MELAPAFGISYLSVPPLSWYMSTELLPGGNVCLLALSLLSAIATDRAHASVSLRMAEALLVVAPGASSFGTCYNLAFSLQLAMGTLFL
jgi:hypothetical protein